MKIFIIIVLFFIVVGSLAMLHFQNIDTSFKDSMTGLFFFYPPVLQISSGHNGFGGENSDVVLRVAKINDAGSESSAGTPAPSVSVSIYSKSDDSELEQWLTFSRSRFWAMSKNVEKSNINGHRVLLFSLQTLPYPAKIAYVDLGNTVVLVAAEYENLASETLVAWKKIIESVDITSH